jgi:hypothetical protein
MNKIFAANSIDYLVDEYLSLLLKIKNRRAAYAIEKCLLPFIFLLMPIWIWFYMQDILSNVYDYVCMKIFVELPLWGLKNSENTP